MWPIFAQGGDYGPKYDMLEANGDLDIDENDFEKRSAAEIFVDSLTKKGWYIIDWWKKYCNQVSIFSLINNFKKSKT